jgi:hypothetical protein
MYLSFGMGTGSDPPGDRGRLLIGLAGMIGIILSPANTF